MVYGRGLLIRKMIAFTHKFPTPHLSKGNIQDGLNAAKVFIDSYTPSSVSIEENRVLLKDKAFRLRKKNSPLQLFSKGSIWLDLTTNTVFVRLEYVYLLIMNIVVLSGITSPLVRKDPFMLYGFLFFVIANTAAMYFRSRKFARNIHSKITEALEDPFKP